MLYNSDFLSVEKRDDLLIQKWKNKNLSVENFQKELYKFLEIYLKVKPNSVLWLQEKFDFNVPHDLHNWIEDEILSHQIKNGIKDIMFTIAKDKMVHLSVIDTVSEVTDTKVSKFFLHEEDALKYLNQKKYDEKENQIYYELLPKKDKVSVELDVSYSVLPKAVNCLSALKKQIAFVQENYNRFNLLTPQETNILKLICQGFSTKEIAGLLFIEVSTVLTHRKKINKKLQAKSSVDLYRYAIAFSLIEF